MRQAVWGFYPISYIGESLAILTQRHMKNGFYTPGLYQLNGSFI